MAPSLADSPRVQGHRDYVIKTLLHGMTGPLDGKTYPAGVMMPFGTNTDDWIAAIASYVRNSFGNRSHNASAARGALTFTRWTTGEPQQAGMWFQVELPNAVQLTENPVRIARSGRKGRWTHPAARSVPRGYRVEVVRCEGSVGHARAEARERHVDDDCGCAGSREVIRITQTASVQEARARTIQRFRLFEVRP